MRRLIACVLLLSACRTPQRPEESYQQALRASRQGNAAEALALARKASQGCPAGSECRHAARLLEAETLLRDGRLDAAASVLSEPIPEHPSLRPLEARRWMLQGGLQIIRGKFEEAQKLLHQSEELAASLQAWDVLCDAQNWQGQLLFGMGRPAEADAMFHRELAQASAQRDSYHQALAFNGLGMIRLKQSRFDEAIPWFQRTTEAANRSGIQRMTSAASVNLGICYSSLGNFDEALQSLRHAIDLLGPTGLATYRSNLLGEMAGTYLRQGDVAGAIPYYQQALALARTADEIGLWHRNLAAAFIQNRDWDQAERSNRAALLRARDAQAQAFVQQNAAAIAAGRSRYEEAVRLYQEAIRLASDNPVVLWESHAGLAEVYTQMGDAARADQEFTQTLAIISQNVRRLSRDDYKLTFFSRLIGFYQSYVRALVGQRAFERALAVADSSRARILFERLALKRDEGLFSGRDYQKIARLTGSTLLFYWLAPQASYLWVVTPGGIRPPLELPPAGQIQQWVEQYRAAIEQRSDPISRESASGRRLYEALVAPARSLIPRGSKVILVPDGALHWLNFETLPVYGDAPHYWIEDVRLAVAPSLSVLLTSREQRQAHPSESLLLIGNPVSPSPEFPTLTYASEEIDRIRQKFPAGETRTFTGAEANPAVYRQAQPGRFSFLHFSAHAVANQQSPLDSAIILSAEGDNYKLYARNVMTVPIRADLVTISACRSAGARSYSGEGLVGFAWAFLQAGARNVIAGLWDVADSSTPQIMDVLYDRIRAGKSPAEALREAKLNLIHSPQAFRRPYYWGPFQLYLR